MFNSYTSWQPLQQVIVGRCYSPDYFDYIRDSQVRDQLGQILAETVEDLDGLQQIIEQYGAEVLRPDLPDREDFQLRAQQGRGVQFPPLTPRVWQITLGDQLLRIVPMPEFDGVIAHNGGRVVNPHRFPWDPNCVLNGASASCIVRVGRDIFFDNSAMLRPEQSAWIRDHCLDSRYRVHEAVTDGHGDSVFAILKPGVILSSRHDVNLNFEQDFPGWQVLRIQDTSIEAAMAVGQFRYEAAPGAWYVQGSDPTDEFRTYVDTYLTEWTGFVAETVFDVNCLVLDESHVIFSAENPTVFRWCESLGITPIVSPLRHSYFWDGGISCCTQDLRRSGGLETYL